MEIKAAIIDFDGTIVTEDITDILCDLVGKKEESERLNALFHQGQLKGLGGLMQRINFLSGLSLQQIRGVVAEDDFLRAGTEDLFAFLRENNIVSIIASGNIMPLLEVYQEKLGADYLVASKPIVRDDRIVAISENEYSGPDFKVRDCTTILAELKIPHDGVVAIGDSPADKGIFGLAHKSIAIDPKGDIAEHADYVIAQDLSRAIPILQELMQG